jgi:hypothetical protein
MGYTESELPLKHFPLALLAVAMVMAVVGGLFLWRQLARAEPASGYVTIGGGLKGDHVNAIWAN